MKSSDGTPRSTGVDKEVFDEYAVLNEEQIYERIKPPISPFKVDFIGEESSKNSTDKKAASGKINSTGFIPRAPMLINGKSFLKRE